MYKCTLSVLARFLLVALSVALTTPSGNGQTTTTRIPTAAQVAMANKLTSANHHQGAKMKMGKTTNYQRWQAAIKNADRRAARIRAGHKGGK